MHKAFGIAFSCTGIGVAIFSVVPHCWLTKTWHWYTRKNDEGVPVYLPEETKDLVDIGFFGALLCLPGSCSSREPILKRLESESTFRDTDKPKLVQLADLMVLSPNAEKFVIAREIFACDSSHIHVHVAIPFILSMLGAAIVDFLIVRETRIKQRLPVRVPLFVMIYLQTLVLMRYCMQLNRWEADQTADLRACKMGKDYAEGGVEFYTKLKLRNMLLYEMLTSKSDQYSLKPDGDHTGFTWYYLQSQSPSIRLKIAQEQLANYETVDKQDSKDLYM